MIEQRGLRANLVESTCREPFGAVIASRGTAANGCTARGTAWHGILAALLAACVVSTACAGGAGGTGERYPEKKRPDAPRSASDGEVLGASRQDPTDTLAGSLTNEHPAPRSPHAEEPAEAAHERLEYERCLAASKSSTSAAATSAAAATATWAGEPRKRTTVCPPPPSSDN